jgi:predicted enzyme related to lactoylglutathione lyase
MDPALAASMQYHDIITGDVKEGTLSMGRMYKRQMPDTPIIDYVMVENLDKVMAIVEKSGGKIIMPVKEIKSVGFTAIIQDTDGNAIGLWKPAMI